MKTTPIYMKRWLEANGRKRALPGDTWYLNFANEVLPLVAASPLFQDHAAGKAAQTALDTALYFQDAIAQAGGWKAFTARYRMLYGQPLPFYACNDYIDDEINRDDVCFLLWKNLSGLHPSFHFLPPHEAFLMTLAGQLYDRMDSLFEEAPINEIPSTETWVMDLGLLDTVTTPLPEVTPDSRLTKDVERCLAYSHGHPLLYFATYGDLHAFLTGTLEWEDHPGGVLADLKDEKDFVIYANAKGMLLAPGVASCFFDSRNPAYNAAAASVKGYELFCLPGRCPFDLLKYGMQHGLLPDAALPFAGGREVLQRHWDFIARYFLEEYYEGD
ncbi:DUF3843 family protein [Mediterranea massiliensis]|uniref:DUF3843 family protein n=1 Tax=Mediterranea massiliensis TaxID=1841865 RepID=UPI00320894DD